MKREQQTSNTQKSILGNKYERELYISLKTKRIELKLKNLNHQKKFYYSCKTPEEQIAEIIKNKYSTYSKKTIEKEVKEYLATYEDSLLRNNKEYYKMADISFLTENKYLINNKLSNIRFIIDTTTSVRGDRLKAKAQDAAVYKSFGKNFINLIVLPNDYYFVVNGYANPKKEANLCKKAIYDNNFCNLFKEEGSIFSITRKRFIRLYFLYKNKKRKRY